MDVRQELRDRVHELDDKADGLGRRSETWVSDALKDIQTGKLQTWASRHQQITELLERASPLVGQLGSLVDVRLGVTNAKHLVPHARTVRELLQAGTTLRLDGSTHKPKQGLLTPRPIKNAVLLFDNVLVDGLPPTTMKALDTFLTYMEATDLLDALDQAWPSTVQIPIEDSLPERLSWHLAEVSVLTDILELGHMVIEAEGHLASFGLASPDWKSPADVQRLAQLFNAVDSEEEHAAATVPLAQVETLLQHSAQWEDAAPAIRELHDAAARRDVNAYRSGYRRLQRLLEVRDLIARRDALNTRLQGEAPRLAAQLVETINDPVWEGRLTSLEASWRWQATARWITTRSHVDVNGLQDSYNETEDRIRQQVKKVAATKAWSHAVERLGPMQRADLTQYAQLVARYGKGTSKYATQRMAAMREAMQRSRTSVPVWIMPLYRIAQSIDVDANLFDVVIVDEASQAGLEATFLQYLAPKIVVIGDDKQVSPRAVGVNQAQLQQLADQFLYDDRYKASWMDPKRSLFDEARMRFGDLITLVEHRRCVPDIIGFSNRVAYEPDGIRLIPVRQTGSQALEPIKPVLVPDAYARGGKVNPAEVEAIAEQIEKCLGDERYDNLTFGVISRTGAEQARAIEKALLGRLDPREWRARDLRCGTAADFQGSERDVMFLSMMAVREEGVRPHALTGDMYVQQFNVAASRAKDQMWVFHSIRLDELPNRDDMRWHLLDYCYGITRRRSEVGDGHLTMPVPEDRLVGPFDSLFEQRVHNRIFDRGYSVIPQYETNGYRIDLVIVGAQGKLAVECDGDHWHGPERYEADLARQRELQRSGWRFFRVRESDFNIARAGALAPLWKLLDDSDIRPSGWEQAEPRSAPARDARSTPAIRPTSVPVTNRNGMRRGHLAAANGDVASSVSAEASLLEEPLPGFPLPARNVGTRAAQDLAPQRKLRSAPSSSIRPRVAPVESMSASAVPLRPYRAWDTSRRLPDPRDHRPSDLIDGLRQIVDVEGPILGTRLYQLYVKSTGGHRVGRELARHLNVATSSAVARKLLLADNPLNLTGQRIKTFRLEHQPAVDVRELGSRQLAEVPPAELATVMCSLRRQGQDEESWFRRVLNVYGLKRLTDNTRTLLRDCAHLC